MANIWFAFGINAQKVPCVRSEDALVFTKPPRGEAIMLSVTRKNTHPSRYLLVESLVMYIQPVMLKLLVPVATAELNFLSLEPLKPGSSKAYSRRGVVHER